jgi:hypothetical protein
MAFMQPQVYQGQYFAIETSIGTEFVPADVIGRTVGTAAEAFENYCEGTIDDPEECVECKTGWLARMSAPGYMDCTDWCAYESEVEAWEDLIRNYGDDEPGSVTYRWLPADWASYLINGDASGLSDREQDDCDEWQASETELDLISANCIGEAVFTHTADSGHRNCDCLFFLFTCK